jgi:hypothetical protein
MLHSRCYSSKSCFSYVAHYLFVLDRYRSFMVKKKRYNRSATLITRYQMCEFTGYCKNLTYALKRICILMIANCQMV